MIFHSHPVLHGPLQPHTVPGDSTHPTGFFRDGYCWGVEEDVGQHYVAGVVTKEFLEFSWEQGEFVSGRVIDTLFLCPR